MEHKLNTGTLFKNDHKTEDKHPSYKGTINIGGELKNIALWKRTKQNGDVYLSVQISDKRQKPQEEDEFIKF